MEILYSDKNIVVAVKPCGISSQAGTPQGTGMPELLAKEGFPDCFVVHRLDTATRGIMVYARTKQAAADLSAQVSGGKMTKIYHAVVYGSPEEESGIMEDLLFKDSSKNKTFVVKRSRRGVKEAKLAYEVVSHGHAGDRPVSLVKIRLFTGRTHQIRVQFASRKMPLCGDGKYGSKDNLPLALCCTELNFFNPETKKEEKFTIPVPGWEGITFPENSAV